MVIGRRPAARGAGVGDDRGAEGSDSAADALLTREEVRSGLPARRAHAALFLIEIRAARLADRSRRALDLFPTERSDRERDLAFLEAFALGRDPPRRPTIQDLEQHARAWAELAPDNPPVRAAVAHLLGRKYAFAERAVPGIRAALGLDEPTVRDAYERLYGRPLEAIYAPGDTPADRLRWAWAALGNRLLGLPPFWFTLLLTFALGIPQAVLAVPIAVAATGPLPAIGLTLAAGLVGLVTTTSMAEAAARSGVVRYGNAYTGKLAADYLGPAGSALLGLALFVAFLLTILAGFFAIAATLARLTGVPAVGWAALLFVGGVYLLSRGSVTFSVAVLVVLACVALGAMVMLMVLTLGQFRLEHVTGSGALLRDLQPSSFESTVGVVLMVYFCEGFVVQCAKVVLPRDPSGRSLIGGSVAGLAAIAALLSAWILVVNGSLPPAVLAGQAGTVVEPLAAAVGSGAAALGLVLILLLPGMAALRCMIGAFNQVSEWLPTRASTVMLLPREGGHLIIARRGGPVLSLTYLGLDGGEPRFRLDVQSNGSVHHEEIAVAGRWEAAALLDRLPELRKSGVRLALSVVNATDQVAGVEVTTPLAVAYVGNWDVAAAANVPRPTATDVAGSRAWRPDLGDRARFLLAASPIAAIFLIAEWLLLTGRDSFTGVLGIIGVLTNSVFGGVIPVLLLLASRRKGEVVPGVVLPFVGHPLVVVAVYVLYILVLLFHGLVVWQEPAQRAAALLTTAIVLGVTAAILRGGALNRRLVVELRHDLRPGRPSAFAVTAVGRPANADVRLEYPDGEQRRHAATGEVPSFVALRRATFELPATRAAELKVWAYRVTTDGSSQGLPALVEIETGGETKPVDLEPSGGQAVLPLGPGRCRLAIVPDGGRSAPSPTAATASGPP
jgi:hypothetical protein